MEENSLKPEQYMRRAIELARLGDPYTHPNPLVGAVIVKDGRMIGEGYHEMYGDLHAERNALAHCQEDPRGAVMYVTLEPCCHHGKQPPCTEAIIEAGISEVFVGSSDPNPLVAGKGVSLLKQAGIKVTTGFLEDECDALNPVFFHYITTGLPYVTMKYAMTADGKIASSSGKSKWITSEGSRHYVHELRAQHMAIMAGIGTVLADDPMLNVRDAEGPDPVRVICDTGLRTPPGSKLVKTAKEGAGNYRDWLPKTIIATSVTDPERLKPYQDSGVYILNVPEDESGMTSIPEVMRKLGEMKIDSVLVEGGAALNWSVIKSGLASHAYYFIAPMILGGKEAKTPVEGAGFDSPAEASGMKNIKVRAIGSDVLIEGDF